MARTASMTTAEAEAELGPRGTIRVTSENRATVRKWLVAQGMPSLFVGGLSYTELGLAYNQTNGETLAKLRAKLDSARADTGDSDDTAAPLVPTMPAPANGHAHNQDAAALLRDLILNGWTPQNVGVDAEQVRTIVRQELPSFVNVTRLELVTPQGIVKDLGTAPRHINLVRAIRVVSAMLPLMLIGPAGSGKTTAAEQIAHALELPFYIQGAVTGAHELMGFVDAHGRYQSTPFRQAFEHGGLICLDEIDAGDAAGILVLNAALANGHMSFPDQTAPIKRHANFRVVACANTYGHGADRIYVGRNQLDGATLDRFQTLNWDYDEKLEAALCPDSDWCKRVQSLRAAASKLKARVIISPRASINGAILLAAGETRANVEDSAIWKGIDSELRRQIEANAN